MLVIYSYPVGSRMAIITYPQTVQVALISPGLVSVGAMVILNEPGS
jgi:hypothetical protein